MCSYSEIRLCRLKKHEEIRVVKIYRKNHRFIKSLDYQPSTDDVFSPKSPKIDGDADDFEAMTNKARGKIEIIDTFDVYQQDRIDEIKEQERLYRNRIMNELRVCISNLTEFRFLNNLIIQTLLNSTSTLKMTKTFMHYLKNTTTIYLRR